MSRQDFNLLLVATVFWALLVTLWMISSNDFFDPFTLPVPTEN
jgi:hypothetical protein